MIRTLVLLLLSVPSFAQIKGNAGFIANFTPATNWGFNAGISYDIPKTGDQVGYMVMENNYKAYYIPYYGTKIGKQTKFLSGINFVNDYSGDYRRLSQTFMVGFNYDFVKPYADQPFSFYTGFLYTQNYFLLRAGFDLEFWDGNNHKQKSKRRRL